MYRYKCVFHSRLKWLCSQAGPIAFICHALKGTRQRALKYDSLDDPSPYLVQWNLGVFVCRDLMFHIRVACAAYGEQLEQETAMYSWRGFPPQSDGFLLALEGIWCESAGAAVFDFVEPGGFDMSRLAKPGSDDFS